MTEDKRPDRGLIKNVKVGGSIVLGWLALTAANELLASLFEESGFGKRFWQYGLNVVYFVVPAGLIILLWLYFRRPRDPDEVEAEPVEPVTPPRWYERAPLIGRVEEVRAGVTEVRANGVVVVVGPRDIGTSAVGQGIVQKLIDDHKAEKNRTYRFDLRSRSARGPDDAAATAGRVVSPFGVAMPADDSAEVLARVAGKLVDRFRGDKSTLMLDNVSTPEQVGWLVREWPTSGPPYLVIAGEPEVAEAIGGGRPVTVGQLEPQHLRAIWEAELAAPERRRARRWRTRVRRLLTAVRRRAPDNLDRLLPYLLGRPKAVELLAAEIRRTDGRITVADLVRDLGTDDPRDESASGPLVRVWKVILGSIREGLSVEASWLLDALSELPVTGLTRTTVQALLQGDDESALDELWDRNLVEEVDERFRLPQELRRAVTDTNTDERRATVIRRALPALLAFYAKHVASQAVRLDRDPAAHEWFKTSEESLRPLVSTEYYRDDSLLAQVLDDLTSIADGLEKWYVREQKSVNLRKVGQGLFALAERVGRPDLAALGAIRTAIALRIARRPGDARTQLDLAEVQRDRVQRNEVRRDLETRIWVERALLGDDEAKDGLSRVKQSPTVLLNRAVLCLAAGAIDDARNLLAKAERLASASGDLGCVAHCLELRGIALSYEDGDLPAAAVLWQRARLMFGNLGEKHSEARCLQHLGAAALIDTEVAASISNGATDEESLSKAIDALLEGAKELRAGQPDTGLADHYLAETRAQLS